MGLCTTVNVEGGSDSVMGEPTTSLDRSSVLSMTATMNAPFLVPSTITPLSNKCIWDIEVPTRKSSPLPIKQLKNKNDEDFQEGRPIIEEKYAPCLGVAEEPEGGLAHLCSTCYVMFLCFQFTFRILYNLSMKHINLILESSVSPPSFKWFFVPYF